ncbi:uncharacterized protein C14orf119 isoform X1 [Plutella xylostella]|uniref:uncharacterized protein C14orf119 isoform X1 n=2 Tax=Plutella xylostella TaxID=51655 RepID=UPI002032F9D1|nr:uncharacterized protein C14orf119 isoform X1 [Plutella xylostella]
MSMLVESVVCLSSSLPESDQHQHPVPRRMSSPGLTSAAQLRYILQWFGEFSELQREDFLPILAAASRDNADQLAAILARLSCNDKPSLFQCRIKLFNEWYPTWSEEEQHRLIKGVAEIDADFGQKLEELTLNGPQLNGDSNGIHSPDIPQEEVVDNNESPDAEEKAEENIVPESNIPVEIAAAS